MDARYQRLADVYAEAVIKAPAVRDLFARAGLNPRDIKGVEQLSKIPVTKKEALLALQRENPPFGGFLAADMSQVARIYCSPGPILEPAVRGEDVHGFRHAFKASGIGPGDIVLNTWSYHMVPAGLLFDEGLQALGATVIPSGVGNTELQAQLILELGVTAICASTGFFVALAEHIESTGKKLPEEWKVKVAFLGGEFGDWMGKRRRLEERYRLRTSSAYATADLGIIAFEDGGEGYLSHPDRIVQICDPVSGQPLAAGEPGEIVVTQLHPGWPMIRFGTGDVAFALESFEDGTARRISALQGRVGQAVKAREIFVYPRQIEEVKIAVAGIQAIQCVVTRPASREEIALEVELAPGADAEQVGAAAREAFQRFSRLRADHFRVVDAGSIKPDAPLVVDRKDV